MAEIIKVAETDELQPGQAKRVDVKGHLIALFNIEGNFYAIADICTHLGGPLSEGTIEGYEVTCPWRGATLDVRTGEVLGPPAKKGVQSYRVQVEGSDIKIEIP